MKKRYRKKLSKGDEFVIFFTGAIVIFGIALITIF